MNCIAIPVGAWQSHYSPAMTRELSQTWSPTAKRLGQMGRSISKVDSRLRGNDNIDDVIPAKAGIQDESGAKYFQIFKNHAFDPASQGCGFSRYSLCSVGIPTEY